MRDLISKVATWAIMSLCIIVVSIGNVAASDEVEMDHETMCLAKNIYYEAGREQFRGKVAVAQVTLNRVFHERFPETICGVVKQRTRVGSKIICQFSWACEPVGKIRYLSDAWRESVLAAQQVLEANLRMERLNRALYFHATHVNPQWGLERLTRIGNHIFYSESPAGKKSLTHRQK
jgi:spore germination cell wall hydrolase CwlJ-like protein